MSQLADLEFMRGHLVAALSQTRNPRLRRRIRREVDEVARRIDELHAEATRSAEVAAERRATFRVVTDDEGAAP